jgi:hypothetical protein
VPLALPLDHAELLAEAVDFLLGQHVLEDLRTSSPVMASPSTLFSHGWCI